MRKFVKGIVGLKKNFVNANKPEKRTKAKNAAKQGNAGERPDAAARYTVKSSRVNSLLFILHRYLPADKLRDFEGGALNGCHAANLSSK